MSEGIHNIESTKTSTKLWKLFPCTHTPGYQPFTSPDWSVAGCVLDRGKVRPSDPRVFHHDTGTMSNLPAFIKEIVRGDGHLVARRIIIEWRQLMTRCHSLRFGLRCIDGYIFYKEIVFSQWWYLLTEKLTGSRMKLVRYQEIGQNWDSNFWLSLFHSRQISSCNLSVFLSASAINILLIFHQKHFCKATDTPILDFWWCLT